MRSMRGFGMRSSELWLRPYALGGGGHGVVGVGKANTARARHVER